MKTTILFTLLLAAAPAFASAPQVHSLYLTVSNKSCVEVASQPDEEGYSKYECPAIGGLRLFEESGDAREWLSFQRVGDAEATRIAEIGAGQAGFPYLANGKVEIRYVVQNEALVPVGAIYRIAGTDLTDDANRKVEALVVVSFLGKEIEEVAAIDGKSANANEKARAAIDALVQ